MKSLKARAGLATTLVVGLFVVVTAVGLDQAFRESAWTARAERLRGQLYLLMGAAEVDDRGGLTMPASLPEPRLESPDSGLYARVTGAGGRTLWQSPSALGRSLPAPDPGSGLHPVRIDGAPHFALSMHIGWELPDRALPLTFQVVEDRSGFASELAHFRRSLWTYLAGAALLLLVLQALALRWGLRPLRAVEREIQAIERGRRGAVEGRYPAELARLTSSLNALLRQEHARQTRYRNALADLAHSLKTPLAVLRGSLDNPDDQEAAAEQIERMERIIGYQLQRASASGHAALAAPVPLRPAIERLARSLAKVYAGRAAELSIDAEPALAFRGAEDDLTEMLGNLLDNAFKWSGGRVHLAASAGEPLGEISVEDDGPGIPDDEVPTILSRGGRLDEGVPGQGIGLAVVRDIVEAYGGALEIDRSPLGGLRARLRLPGLERVPAER